MDKTELREEILKLVKQYGEMSASESPNFIGGEHPVSPSGKVIGGNEMKMMTDAVLDGWLTTGRFNKQFENRSMSSFTEGGRHKTSGGQNVFGSLDQYQEQESIDWSKGGKDYTNPGWTRQEEQMKIRQAENKAAREEKERIKKLKKNKPPKGSIETVILSWENQTGLTY